jgi:hypothetical protein
MTMKSKGGQYETVASTGELPRVVDAIQYEAQEGPCLDAFVGHHVFRSDDLATDPRWPVFGCLAADRTEVMSMTSHRLFIDHEEDQNLRIALEGNRDIGTAMGILMNSRLVTRSRSSTSCASSANACTASSATSRDRSSRPANYLRSRTPSSPSPTRGSRSNVIIDDLARHRGRCIRVACAWGHQHRYAVSPITAAQDLQKLRGDLVEEF